MTVLNDKYTNIFGDTEVSGRTPDAEGDFYLVTDAQADHNYWQGKIVDIISLLSNSPTEEFQVLYGCVVSDGGSGTIDISAGVAKGKDSNGKKRLIPIPTLSGVSLPSGWNDDRQIWVIAKYDFKLTTDERTHRVGTDYHYKLQDTCFGDSNGYVSTSSDDLFTDSDPTGTAVILGSFKMNGTTYADQNVRTASFLASNADLLDGAHKDTDGTLSGNSDSSIPTEKAVKTYVDVRTNDVMPLSYLDTDPIMAADSDLKIPSQKAVNANFKNININNKLIALRHLEKYPTALSQASHRLLEIGGDYIIMGSNANGSYWRSYRGNYPVLLNSGTSNLLDYSGMCVWLQNNEWLFNFRNGGLYYCPDISIATPIFISRIAGSFVYRALTRVVENGEIVVYGLETSNQQVIKLTNNGLTQVVLYTAPQPISSMAKIGNKLIAIVAGAPTYIYYSLDLGTTWQSTTLTPTSPRVSDEVFALKNVFCIPTIYNNNTPMIYTSETGETWSLKYTGNNSAYSLDLKPINVDDKFFVWLEENSAGGFRIMHTFTEDFSQIEIPIVHSSGAPSVCKFFENMFIVSGDGTTPGFWKSPPLL